MGLKADIPSPEQLVAVRTPLTPFQDSDGCETMRCVVLTPGADYETPGVHHAGRRRGRVAAGGRARAAAGDAGDRVRQRPITKRVDGSSCSLPPRAGETGFVEGQNLVIAFRWAEGRYHQLPALAGELVGLRVGVLVAAGGTASALAAK